MAIIISLSTSVSGLAEMQEQAEYNLMVAISGTWYIEWLMYHDHNKPIKSLELHYTMIQFLITINRT